MDRKLQRHRADSLRQHGFLVFLADRTNGRAIGTMLRLSACLSVCLSVACDVMYCG